MFSNLQNTKRIYCCHLRDDSRKLPNKTEQYVLFQSNNKLVLCVFDITDRLNIVLLSDKYWLAPLFIASLTDYITKSYNLYYFHPTFMEVPLTCSSQTYVK